MSSEFSGANTEAYLVDLDRILQDVLNDIYKPHSKQEYITNLHHTIGRAAVYTHFDIALGTIGGRLFGSDDNFTQALQEFNRLYGGIAIRDGFLFGMAINNKLLMGESNCKATSNPLDALDSHIADVMQTIGDITVAPRHLTTYFESYAEMLYDNTLAHPNNPDAKDLNSDEDPFKYVGSEICNSLYQGENLPLTEATAQHERNTHHFQYGYAIARAGMNAYNLQIISQLDQLFQDPAATIDG